MKFEEVFGEYRNGKKIVCKYDGMTRTYIPPVYKEDKNIETVMICQGHKVTVSDFITGIRIIEMLKGDWEVEL